MSPLGECEVEVIKPGKDDIIVLKVEKEITDDHMVELKETADKAFAPRKVVVINGEVDIEVIPALNRHYGVWVSDREFWSNRASGEVFSSISLGVAHIQKRRYVGEGLEVRVINDDGTPGEVV